MLGRWPTRPSRVSCPTCTGMGPEMVELGSYLNPGVRVTSLFMYSSNCAIAFSVASCSPSRLPVPFADPAAGASAAAGMVEAITRDHAQR